MGSEAEEFTLADLLRVVRRSWKVIIGLAVTGALIATAVAFVMSPVYRAEVLLAPAPAESGGNSALSRLAQQLPSLSGLLGAGDLDAGVAATQVRVAILRSRRLTEEFIRERNLLPLLFPNKWDVQAGRWELKGGIPSIPSMNEAVRVFDEKIRSVTEDRRTGLITLAIDWRDPRVAADWSNDLIARANEFMRKRAIDESKRSISFLEDELRKTGVVERQQIIYRLIESRTGEIMLANGRQEYAFQVVDPAVAPDADRFVRPRRGLLAIIGFILGMLVGVAYAIVRSLRKSFDLDVISAAK